MGSAQGPLPTPGLAKESCRTSRALLLLQAPDQWQVPGVGCPAVLGGMGATAGVSNLQLGN